MGKMHAGRLGASERVDELDKFLRQFGLEGATTWSIQDSLRICAASTVVSELRMRLKERGETVERLYDGVNENGRRVHRYRIVALPPKVEQTENAPCL